MADISGLNVGQMFKQGFDSVSQKGDALQKKMTEALGKGDLSQQELLNIQFEMGQFNAMLELVSSVSKSLTDTLKSIGQRTG